MDLAAHSVPEQTARGLTDLLDAEIERGGLFTVISRQDLRSLLKAEEVKRLMGAESEMNEAMARLASAADAPFLLHGSVGKVGDVSIISLNLLDARQTKVVRRVKQTLVGDESGLVGSIRTAALALNLEEKGVESDISAELIDGLLIAERKKALFVALSPGYEIPVGAVHDPSSVAYFRPSFAHLRLDVERPTWRMLRLFLSLSYASTVSEQMRMQDKHLGIAYDAHSGEPRGEKVMVATTTLDYTAQRILLHLGMKVTPETGRFLPFGLLGAGVSWQGYSFSDERLGLLHETAPDGGCGAPYAVHGEHCRLVLQGRPEADVTTLGVGVVAGAGLEWLLTHNLGLRIEGRYDLTYALKGERELDALFVADQIEYDVETPSGTVRQADRYGDTFPVRKVHHGIVFSAGAVAYW